MGGLFDDIQGATRRNNMMAHFQKKASGTVDLNEVVVEKVKTAKQEKDKGLIKPAINYIEDEVSDAPTG